MIKEAQDKINNAYNLFGFAWKERADSLFKPGDAAEVWENIRGHNLLPPLTADILIVSPTASIPRHEIAIWENESEMRKGNTVVVAGDIRAIDLDAAECTLPPQKNDASFHYVRLDAAQIPIKNDSVDVIWDRKGWLWHVANNAFGKYLTIEDAFAKYHSLLKIHGIIIIDANPHIPDNLGDFTSSGQMEPSTVDMIKFQIRKRRTNIWNNLEEKFDTFVIGKDKQKVRVLRKRPAQIPIITRAVQAPGRMQSHNPSQLWNNPIFGR